MDARTVVMDPLEEVATRQIPARLWQNGKLIKEEIHTQQVADYNKNEPLPMPETAGFRQVQVNGDYSDQPAAADHNTLVFNAAKQPAKQQVPWRGCPNFLFGQPLASK